MTKTELAELVLSPKEFKSFDIAIPKHFSDVLRDLGIEDYIIRNFVWVYSKDDFTGRPVNLIARAYEKYRAVIEGVSTIDQEFSEYIKSVGEKTALTFFPALSQVLYEANKKERKWKLISEIDDLLGLDENKPESYQDIGEDLYQAVLYKIAEKKGSSQLMNDPGIKEQIRKALHQEVMDYCKELIKK